MKTALVILAEGFEEMEAVCPVDLLRRAGVETTLASLGETKRVAGKNGIQVLADEVFAEVADREFDLLVLPGGPGVVHLRQNPKVAACVRQQYASGRLIGAICAAPLVLRDAGVLQNLRYTAHPSTAGELTAIAAGQRVVIDQNVITSRGAGTAVDFGLALVEHLVGKETAADIKTAICA